MTKNGKRSIKICHPDISKCRNRITLGLHIDFSFTYNGRYLEITDIFPLKEKNNIPKKKDSFKVNNNAKKFDINFDFPSLNSTIKIVNVSSSVNNYSSALSSTTDIIDTKIQLSCNSTVNECEAECNLKDVTAKADIEIDIEANIETIIETESDSFSELVSSNTKKIIVPPELIKKLNFTLNHLNNEREILKKSFIELENETIKEVKYLEEDLYNKYGRIVNDTDFTYSIS
tara:strand:- start:67 stop:759 length:693 start_codon:yes stop_codon:yes gene_type:complete